jgi:hypothetical protein
MPREGIVHERKAAYTPEQNEVAEWYNRTPIERTRCLLHEHKLPMFLWGNAIMTASHIRNLMPETGQNLCPYEMMFAVKPAADYLRIFGCTAHVHVRRHLRDKMEPTLVMFVGCALHSKAWRVLVWRSTRFKVIESASVVFAEDQSHPLPNLQGHTYDGAHETDWEDVEDDVLVMGLVPLPTTNSTQHPTYAEIDEPHESTAAEEHSHVLPQVTSPNHTS